MEKDLTRAIRYGAHASVMKETAFIKTDLAEQSWAGHITLYNLQKIRHLPRLWIYPLVAIPQ